MADGLYPPFDPHRDGRRRKRRRPWWFDNHRLAAHCPECGHRYTKARPDWETCLACELSVRGWDDGPIMRAKRDRFVERAVGAFPGAREPEPVPEAEPDPTLFDEAA
jgi:hypothetical protein